MKRILFPMSMLLLLAFVPSCGSGGGDSAGGGTQTTLVKADIHWPARSRTLNAPSSALSAILTLPKANPDGTDFKWTINRDAALAEHTVSYTSNNQAKVGTWPFVARFFASAGGAGSVVGVAASTVALKTDGSGIGNIAVVGTVASVEVAPGQSVLVGQTKALVFTARDSAGDILALTPGSAFFVVASGADNLQVSVDGQARGLAVGSASVVATVDGKTSPAQTVTVTSSASNGGLAATAWAKYRADAQNTARSKGSGAQGVIKWQFNPSQWVESPAEGPGGILYTGDGSGTVYALFAATGAVKWRLQIYGQIWRGPALAADGTLYVGTEAAKLYAINTDTGQLKWTFPTGGAVRGPATVGTDGTVYFGSLDGKIYAVNGANGQMRWSVPTGGQVYSVPALGFDGTVYSLSTDGYLYALEGASGQTKWKFKTGGLSGWGAPSVGADGTVYVGNDDGYFYALNGATGTKKWQFQVGPAGSPLDGAYPAIGPDGTVYVGGTDGNFYALNGTTGAVRWQIPVIRFTSAAIGSDGTVYIVEDGVVVARDGASGASKWQVPVGASGADINSQPVVGGDGTIYVGSDYQMIAIR
jgi:outer membrane protein assembly factor BamB